MIIVMRYVWKEIGRKRVAFVAAAMSLVFLLLYAFVVYEMGKGFGVDNVEGSVFDTFLKAAILISLGFFFANFVVAYMAIFSTVGAVSTEVESGLLLAILPRPIRRFQWYAGKWLGYASWSVFYSLLLYAVIVGIVAAKFGLLQDTATLLQSFAVFALIPLTLVTVTMLGSTFLPTLGNGVIMVLLFGLGVLGGMLERMSAIGFLREETQMTLQRIGTVVGMIIPTDPLFRRMTYVLTDAGQIPMTKEMLNALGPFANPIVPSSAFLWYAIAYIVVIFAWGMWRFVRKDI